MPVKLFTHANDLDGLGCAILAKLVYENLDITFVPGIDELNMALNKFIKDEEYLSYNKIYITDLCPSELLLRKIEETDLKDKVLIFDHHRSSIENLTKSYSFLTEKIEEFDHLCCATSIFYEFLLDKEPTEILTTSKVKKFVSYTRLHDTWEWKKENNLDAYALQTLHTHLGVYGYYYHFLNKLLNEEEFVYTKEEQKWLKEEKDYILNTCQNVINNMLITKQKNNLTYAIIIGYYKIRNDIAKYLGENYSKYDILFIIDYEANRFSFRSLKADVPVYKIAEMCGGGGHTNAAGGFLNKENILKVKKFFET